MPRVGTKPVSLESFEFLNIPPSPTSRLFPFQFKLIPARTKNKMNAFTYLAGLVAALAAVAVAAPANGKEDVHIDTPGCVVSVAPGVTS